MTKSILFATLCLILIISGCTRTKTKDKDPVEKVKELGIVKPVEIIPSAVGVSDIEEELTPFPNCDGGECYDVSFTIGIKLNDETISHSIPVIFRSYTLTAGTAKKEQEVLAGRDAHHALSKADPKKVVVTLFQNEITKITTIEEWSDNKFKPAEVLWQK